MGCVRQLTGTARTFSPPLRRTAYEEILPASFAGAADIDRYRGFPHRLRILREHATMVIVGANTGVCRFGELYRFTHRP